MSRNNRHRGLLLYLASAGLLLGCTAKTPAVSFEKDIKPILDTMCVECHRQDGEGSIASGLMLDSYAGLMRGTQFGRVVIPGDSLTSALTMLIEGRADPSISMPHNEKEMDPAQVALIKTWVEQGAKDN